MNPEVLYEIGDDLERAAVVIRQAARTLESRGRDNDLGTAAERLRQSDALIHWTAITLHDRAIAEFDAEAGG